jgi:hypothetical protein
MEKHPLRIAFETLDIDLFDDAVSEDVVFYTPILTHAVAGRDFVKRVFLTGISGFGPPQVTDEFTNGDGRRIITWDSTIQGNSLQAALLAVDGPDGKVSEIRVYMRPLPVVSMFRDYMYPHFSGDLPAEYWEAVMETPA